MGRRFLILVTWLITIAMAVGAVVPSRHVECVCLAGAEAAAAIEAGDTGCGGVGGGATDAVDSCCGGGRSVEKESTLPAPDHSCPSTQDCDCAGLCCVLVRPPLVDAGERASFGVDETACEVERVAPQRCTANVHAGRLLRPPRS